MTSAGYTRLSVRANWWCWAPPARCPPGTATTTATCCAGTGEGILFDPGEGTQRQMLRAGVAAHDLDPDLRHALPRRPLPRPGRCHPAHQPGPGAASRHGALPGQRAALLRPAAVRDRVPRDGRSCASNPSARPASWPRRDDGQRVRRRSALHARARGGSPTPSSRTAIGSSSPTHGACCPSRLAAARHHRARHLAASSATGELRGVRLEEVSEPRRGQRFAFVMDTRMCDGGARARRGLRPARHRSPRSSTRTRRSPRSTAISRPGRRARWRRRRGVRSLVLTHFSQRYTDASHFDRQAREAGFEGELTVAEDLTRVPVPKRA